MRNLHSEEAHLQTCICHSAELSTRHARVLGPIQTFSMVHTENSIDTCDTAIEVRKRCTLYLHVMDTLPGT